MTALDLTRKLCTIPSVTADKAAVNFCSDFVANQLKKQGLHVRVERCNGYRTVYASTRPGKKCDILLNAHLDVVTAPAAQFKPQLKGNRLYGRGTSDCKGNAAVMMNLLPRLKGKANVGAIFTTDEETGGHTTADMVKKGYAGKLTLVLDGNFDRVITAQKGILSLTLTAKGRTCHASAPWRGDNALDRLIKGYLRIKNLFPKVSERDSWHRTAAATLLHAGEARNQVPGSAEMSLNVRFTDADDPRKLLSGIRKVSGLAVKADLVCPFVRIRDDHPHVQLLLKSLRRRMNPALRLGKMNGATDARHFRHSGGAMAIFGLKGYGAHAADEWLDVTSIPKLEEALYGFITRDWDIKR
ncbi:MAG: M20/M25/M40 family metallo-hydrolase [Fibrobacterota bacterium]